MAEQKSEYRNDSKGMLGVTLFDSEGKQYGGLVRPGDTIWLSERETIATANAPKLDENNPFINGHLTLVTPATEIINRRPLGPDAPPSPEPAEDAAVAPTEDVEATEKAKAEAGRKADEAKIAANPKPPEETGAAVKPSGPAPVGQRASSEEVATPRAPARG